MAAPEQDDKQHVELKLRQPDQKPIRPATAPDFRRDTLMVMLNEKADRELVASTLKDLNATVERTIGEGPMTCLIVKTAKGKFEETEKKLGANPQFRATQRLFQATNELAYHGSNDRPLDSAYPQQWQLSTMDVFPAWAQARGSGVTIAVADSGCSAANLDLAGKLYNGVDVVNQTNSAVRDIAGHGTLVATTAAAAANNILCVGPARDSYVFPINIAFNRGGRTYTDDSYVAQALWEAGSRGIRITNVSYGYDDTNFSYANERQHPVVWQYLRWYRDQRNGLAFFAAGNNNRYDPSPRSPYIIMVSALSQTNYRANFSNYGNCIWFTAPGQNVVTSNMYNQVAYIDGTSFASPLTASMAALILSKNNSLRNDQVLNIMQLSCLNAAGSTWNQDYGFGLPRAARAITLTP